MSRGKKRRLAAALDTLCDTKCSSAGHSALVEEDTADAARHISATHTSTYTPPVRQEVIAPSNEILCSDLKWETILTAQALNLVPESFCRDAKVISPTSSIIALKMILLQKKWLY